MNQDNAITRRTFLKSGAATGAGLAALGGLGLGFPAAKVWGANERVRLAVCGVRGRGFDHIQGFSGLPNVQVAAICDVDENVARRRMADMEKLGLPKPQYYTDVRKLLEDASIDAVSIATPNHWHSLIGIWACQAGKDVYCEKPCSHNWWEGKKLVEAAERYGRIVEHGTQSRSSAGVREAIQHLRAGLIGDLYLSRGLCYKWRPSIGHTPNAPVPPGVHYDLWTGPAPLEPFSRNRFHYNWHWFWDFGNGDLGNQGIHELDVARWALGAAYPSKVSALGGHFLFDDDQQTPNTLNCAFEFDLPNGRRQMLEFEVRGGMTNPEAEIGTEAFGGLHLPPAGLGASAAATPAEKKSLGPVSSSHNAIGNIIYGSKGYMAINGYESYKTWLGEKQEPGPSGKGEEHHYGNFIDCVRSRKKQDLNAPIEEGQISCTLLHLANASYRVGRTLEFNPETQQVINDDEADRLLRDSDRGYRKPFDIPENV